MSLFGRFQSHFSRSPFSKQKAAENEATSPSPKATTPAAPTVDNTGDQGNPMRNVPLDYSQQHLPKVLPLLQPMLSAFAAHEDISVRPNVDLLTNCVSPPDQPACTPRLTVTPSGGVLGGTLDDFVVKPQRTGNKRSNSRHLTDGHSPYRRPSGGHRSVHSGGKTMGSSFYNVSSDEDSNDEDGVVTRGQGSASLLPPSQQKSTDKSTGCDSDSNSDLPSRLHNLSTKNDKAFDNRSSKIRRSINKAQAALPADFADRIGVAPFITSESNQQDRSRFSKSLLHLTDEAPGASSNDDDPDVGGNGVGKVIAPSGEEDALNEMNSMASNGPSTALFYQSGIQWSPDPPKTLEELMPELQCSGPPGSTYLLRPKCQRTGCQCAFREHDKLILFVVPKASLALANWETWAYSTTKGGSNSLRSNHQSSRPVCSTTSTIQQQLIVLRQCRGWYEILNENHQATPHLTTVEQVRRARPNTLLICRDLRCLAAPTSLVVPPIKENRSRSTAVATNGPPPVPFPSSVVAIATSADTLHASTPTTLPAGTLLQYVTYLPHCPLRRGRKIKEVGLILVTTRYTRSAGSSTDTGNSFVSSDLGTTSRAYYIGLEDTTPAVFPVKFDLVPVAGPDNISGVHSLASVLRKFRLPLSIRPVNPGDAGDDSNNNNASRSSTATWGTLSKSPNLGACGLANMPGLAFNDRSYLRLHTHYRSDLLILSPVTNPERLFLITPSMLNDHLFSVGTSEDPVYLQMQENHGNQAAGFLAVAHQRDSLNYLIRHMTDVTREHRDTLTAKRNRDSLQPQSRPDLETAGMSLEEYYRTFEELDSLYFYIRHGYYPSRSRRPETPVKMEPSNGGGRMLREAANTETVEPSSQPRKSLVVAGPTRTGIPTAEDLLAGSLVNPIRSGSFGYRKSVNNEDANARGHTKEHGI